LLKKLIHIYEFIKNYECKLTDLQIVTKMIEKATMGMDTSIIWTGLDMDGNCYDS